MTIHLVANPTSGGGRAGRILPRVVDRLRRTYPDVPLVVQRTTGYDHARTCLELAVAGARRGDRIVVMGGDGMMHLGVNAVAQTDIPLAMIPAGSGNDLCRGLGVPVGEERAALDLMAGGPRRFDLLRLTPSEDAAAPPAWVGSIVASGFDARVNLRANAMTFPRGRAQYPVAVAAELATFRPIHYRLVIDGEVRELDAMLVAIGNTTSFGGGLQMCPDARPDDGLLDITIIHPVGRATLVRMFPAIYSGAFTHLDVVEMVRARSVELSGTLADGTPLTVMGDGEEIGPVPRTVDCVPGALLTYSESETG